MTLELFEHMRVDLVQSVVVFGAELVPKVCSGYSLSQNEPVPLAGQGFLHRWILLDPDTPSVGTDVVASSPMMLCMLECLGISFLWVLWDWVQSQCPRSAQGTGSDWKEPVPLAMQGFLSPWEEIKEWAFHRPHPSDEAALRHRLRHFLVCQQD